MKPSFSLSQALLALTFVSGVLGALLLTETPTGKASGAVLTALGQRPLAGTRVVFTNEDPDAPLKLRRVRTDEFGNFQIKGLPVGTYSVSVAATSHAGEDQLVTVTEGADTSTLFRLKRSRPDLEVAPIQRTFAPADPKFVPLRGYLDNPGQKMGLKIYKARYSHYMENRDLTEALRRAGDRYQPVPGLPPLLLTKAQRVQNLVLPVAGADKEGFFHQRVPLNLKEPGLYLLDANIGTHKSASWVLVTDTALVVKKATGPAPPTAEWRSAVSLVPSPMAEAPEPLTRRHCVAFVSDIKTGTPRQGASVVLYEDGTLLGKTATDAQGLARFVLRVKSSSRLTWVAANGNHEAVLGGTDYSNEETGAYTVAAYTDRPIYRPGDSLSYKGIVRERQMEQGNGAFRAPRGQAVSVELRDPLGNVLVSESRNTNTFGSFWGGATLSQEAPTGFYTLVTTVGGEEHTQDIQVAAYRKPEMTVTVKPLQKRYTQGGEVKMEVDAKYYFGSPVAGAKVNYQIYRATDWAAEYPTELGYEAEDWAEQSNDEYYGEYIREGEATLDATGKAVITFSAKKELEKNEAPEPINPQSEIWSVHATITDETERSVDGQGSVRVTAGNFFLSLEPDGYLALPGQKKNVELLARDFEGKTIPNQNIDLSWGYQTWDENLSSMIAGSQESARLTTDATGKASLEIPVAKGGQIEVTATARDQRGATIQAQTTFYAAAPGDDLTTGADASLELLADQARYASGETARVLINTKDPAQVALLTLEGDGLHRAWVVPLTGASTSVSVPLLEAYGPNVTLAACTIKGGKFLQSEIPLSVKVPSQFVQVEVKAREAKYLPGGRITYEVVTKDYQGKPLKAEFSLGVVDEAIYALKEDDPTFLKDTFYPRRYNSVNTQQSLAVEYLGDANKAAPDVRARRRFVDTAYWLPDGQTDENGRATLSFNLPDNLTRWRATVLAQTRESSFGRGTGSSLAALPFFVRLERPRFAVEGDTTRLQATIHNETGAPQSALVQLDAPGLTTSADAQQRVQLETGASAVVSWPVTVGAADAEIKITAWTADEKWKDAVVETLPVRPFGRERFETFAGSLDKGPQTVTFTHKEGAKNARATLELTASPLEAFAETIGYLVGFPYGCTEQTASRMIPDLLASRLISITGRRDFLSSEQSRQLPQMVRDSIVRLTRMQQSSGGWGWWEYDSEDPFLTAYVLNGLSLAKTQGYAVPQSVLESGAEAALKMAATPYQPPARVPGQPPIDPGFLRSKLVQFNTNKVALLRSAALAGQQDKALALRRNIKLADLSPRGLALLALLDHQTGGDRAAYDALLQGAQTQGPHTFWSGTGSDWNSDESAVSVTALALRAMLAWAPQDPRVASSLRFLMSRRTGSYWESTRDTAETLGALVDAIAANQQAGAKTGIVRVRLNGEMVREINFAKGRTAPLEFASSALRVGKNVLLVEPGGTASAASFSLSLRETEATAELGALKSRGMSLTREYFRLLPSQRGSYKPAVEPTNGQLKQGDDIRVRLTITTDQEISYFLLEDIFPPGCEPTMRGSTDITSSDDWSYWWDSTDIRDDKIAFFAKSLPKGKRVVEYTLRAQTPGTYRVLPAVGLPMYAPENRAETAMSLVEIQ